MISKNNYSPNFGKLKNRYMPFFLCFLSCFFILNSSPVFAQNTSTEEAKIIAQQRLTLYQSLPDTLAEYRFIEQEKVIETIPAHEIPFYEPAVYETVEHDELIKEAYEGYRLPVYKTIEHEVLVKDATRLIEIIPATFETYMDDVQVASKQNILVKKKDFKGEWTSDCINAETGVDDCFWTKVEIPATFKPISKKRIDQPATFKTVKVPAEYIVVNKKIIDWEATKKQPKAKKLTKIAPKYKTFTKQILVRHEMASKTNVPAETVAIKKQVWQDTNNDYYKLFDREAIALNKLKNNGGSIKTLEYSPIEYGAATSFSTRATKSIRDAPTSAPAPAAFMSAATPSPPPPPPPPPPAAPSYEAKSLAKKRLSATSRREKSSVAGDEIFRIIEKPTKELSFAADGVVEEEVILDFERKDKPDNTIKANILTAGEVNDFSKWELWQDIADNDLAEHQEKWQFSPMERYTIQLVTEDGQPLVDTDVQLRGAGSEIVWMAKTDNTGKAELWANLFATGDFEAENNNTSKEANAPTSPPKVLKKDLSVLALVNGKLKEAAQASKFQEGLNILTIDAACNLPQTVDIAMIVDATGSMGDEIEYLKVELNDVIGKVKKENDNLTVNLGSVFYRDHGDAYVTKKSDFSEDIGQTIDFIKKQRAKGGGDFPEAVDDALSAAIYDLQWSEKAVARLLFLVLDAPPHNNPQVIERLAQLARDAANRGIRIIPITGSGIDKSTEYLMRSLALATNGTYTFLTDDSGVGNGHIKPTTDDFEVETLNDLMVRLIRQYTQMPECSKRKRKKKARKAKKELNDELESIVRFYPNPTRGRLNIESQKNTIEELFISDATGKIIERLSNFSGKATIDLSNYPSGYYLIRYPNNADSNRWLTEKIMLIR